MSTLKIKLVKSRFGLNPNHTRVIRALGLRKIGHVKELPDCPAVRGMINKVKYLLDVSKG